jgi:hypothetical protein
MISIVLSYIWLNKNRDIELQETKKQETKKQEKHNIMPNCDICGQPYYWCMCIK